MTSPFPGMDPYLEDQGYWEEFHSKTINTAQEFLADCLPSHYQVRIEERLSVVFESDLRSTQKLRPDLAVLQHARFGQGRPTPPGTMTLEPVTIPLLMEPVEEVRESRIEIRRRPGRTLVTVIELLSPSNKEAPGRKLYEQKRLELIHQPVNLVEIDLLVRGQRLPMSLALPPGDYFAYVSRRERRPNSLVYSWSIRHPLPLIPIPLGEDDPDSALDLATVISTAFERGRYIRDLDYQASLSLPLDPEDRRWAEALAKAAMG